MKKHIFTALLTTFISPSFAQQALTADASQETKMAVQLWLMDLTKELQTEAMSVDPQAKKTTATTGALAGFKPGVHIYSIKDLPAPDAVKQTMLRGVEKSRQPSGPVRPDQVLTEAQARERLAKWKTTSPEALKNHLTFNPAELSTTALGSGELLDAGTVGVTLSDGRSTGLTRTYQVPGMGIITLDEEDYLSSPTLRLALIKESFNSDIDGIPAIASATRTTDGRGSAGLRWLTPSRLYRLSLITDNGAHLEQDQQMLKSIANKISVDR